MQLEFTIPFKQARRREDDISIVTAGVRLNLEIIDEKYFIKDARCAFGGLAPTTILGKLTLLSYCIIVDTLIHGSY